MAYRYTLTVDCFCPGGRFDVVVRNGEVVHSRRTGSGGVGGSGDPPGGLTIDGLFTLVSQARGSSPPAANVTVSYDERFGYPQRISIDRIADAVDDEISYTVSDFRVLEPDPM